MHGMFRANGGCGYVKKPNFLMKKGFHDEVFDPRKKLPVKETLKASQQQLPYILIGYFNISKCYQPYLFAAVLTTGESVYGRWMAYGLQSHSL